MGAKPKMSTVTLDKAEAHDLSGVEKFNLLGDDNPVLVGNSPQLRAAMVAYKSMAEMIKKLDEQQLLTVEDKKELMLILYKIYAERKAESFLSERFHTIANTIRQMIDFTVDRTSSKALHRETSLFYYNSIRHTVKNE